MILLVEQVVVAVVVFVDLDPSSLPPSLTPGLIELSYYYGFFGGIALGGVLMYYKPDTS